MADALCAQTDSEIFHPEKGGHATEARRTCELCTARVACLDYAVNALPIVDGVWGGSSANEREAMRVAASRAAA